MITDKDRSGFFGASDTKFIMGKWQGKTFDKWWLTKLGLYGAHFNTVYTLAGTHYEHRIADEIENILREQVERDTQFILPEYALRVNLDVNTAKAIYEIKTYKDKGDDWQPLKEYVMQVRVQMWSAEKYYGTTFRGYIVAYPLSAENYKNFLLDIDRQKIRFFRIKQDETFIKEYEKRLKTLCACLKNGAYPIMQEAV